MRMIEIRCRTEIGALVVEVVGELTAANAPILTSCLDAAIDADLRAVIVDVGAVRRIDRPAAIALLELEQQLRALGGSLAVRNLDACVDGVADTVCPDGERPVRPVPDADAVRLSSAASLPGATG
jgi:anti-anti-sigma factor